MKVKGLSVKTLLPLGKIIHRPLIWWRKIFGLPMVLRATRRGLTYELDLAEAIDSAIYLTGDFELHVRKVIEKYIRRGNIVLDIGANVGGHTLDLARVVGSTGCVYAFEPTGWAFKKLLTNVSLNPQLKIKPFHVGLTDQAYKPLPQEISASWSLVRPMGEAHPLDMGYAQSTSGSRLVSLDDWMKEASIQKIDAIKIDVDGFETRILRGAVETLKKFHPVIIAEWAPHHFTNPEESFQDMIHLLRSLGYSFYSMNGELIKEEASEIEKSIPWGVLYYVVALKHNSLSA